MVKHDGKCCDFFLLQKAKHFYFIFFGQRDEHDVFGNTLAAIHL